MKRATFDGWLTRRSVAPWDDTEPIRAEVVGTERFEQHAVSLADSHMVVDRSLTVVSIVDRLDDNAAALLQDYRALLTELGQTGHHPCRRVVGPQLPHRRTQRPPRLDLPPSYFKQLPKLGSGRLAGYPRIFGIMWGYVAHTDSLSDPASWRVLHPQGLAALERRRHHRPAGGDLAAAQRPHVDQ